MTNTFIPTLNRNPLYCVWIETGNPAHPLDRVWIDPELRSFVDVEIAVPIRETNNECEPETPAEPVAKKGLFAGQLSITPIRKQERKIEACLAMNRLSWVVVVFCLLLNISWADVAGRISGLVNDPSGALVAGATVALTNTNNGTKRTTTTNDQGQYSFPVVPIGRYGLEINSPGFQPYKKIGIVVDLNSALQVDATLQIKNAETVEVNDNLVTIQMSDTEIGETISSQHVAEAPLNGRSYTDLLATQAGVSPITTSGAANSSSGGGFGTVPVAGNENTGQFSINGQRESANGFFLNGASVQESIGQQAGIIPNLDSIAEFRIISNNADAEYGGYSGGLINVVTKSGGDQFRGSVFEFLRNTNLDARGYFSPERSTFQQNQYGGTFGGPIKKSKVFFFGDYQGQRTVEGIETGIVSVPSLLNRAGNFSDLITQNNPNPLPGSVNTDVLAQTLSKALGYPVQKQKPSTPLVASRTCSVFSPRPSSPNKRLDFLQPRCCNSFRPQMSEWISSHPGPKSGERMMTKALPESTRTPRNTEPFPLTTSSTVTTSTILIRSALVEPLSLVRPVPTMLSQTARTKSSSYVTPRHLARTWLTRPNSAIPA